MANEQDTGATEVSAEPQTEKLSLEGIRQHLVGVNNPSVPVEIRQRALTSLLVEFLDRMQEMRDVLGKRVKILTEQGEKLEVQDQECMAMIQSFMNKGGEALADVAAAAGAAAASAVDVVEGVSTSTNGQVNGGGKKAPKVKVTVAAGPEIRSEIPPPPPPPVVATLPADAAAAAAELNRVAGLPSMPVVGAPVIKS